MQTAEICNQRKYDATIGSMMLHGEWGYVWLGNMVDLDKLTGDGTWGSNRDINIFTVNLNVGVLSGVSGVG